MANALVDNFTKEELEEIVKESYSYRDVIKKIGYTTVSGGNTKTVKNRIEKYNIDTSHFSIAGAKGITRTKENVFCKNSTASQKVLRSWYKKQDDISYQCDYCGISEWQGKELVLQLDHINGDNHDNRLENLHWLCPNCHSQTDTFCGKKKKAEQAKEQKVKKQNYCIDCGKEISSAATRCSECAKIASRSIERPSKEELLQFLNEYEGNFTEAGRTYGTTDNNVRKWCRQYDLPFHTSDYKPKVEIVKKEKTDDGLPKPVIRLNKDTLEELQTYNSMYDAARWLQENGYASHEASINGISSHVGQVCNGKRKTAYKFKWKLKDNYGL